MYLFLFYIALMGPPLLLSVRIPHLIREAKSVPRQRHFAVKFDSIRDEFALSESNRLRLIQQVVIS